MKIISIICFTEKNEYEPDDDTDQADWVKSEKCLGAGRFGKVYLYENNKSGEERAVKEVLMDPDKKAQERLQREVKVLACISHERIVRYFEAKTIENTLYIHMEYLLGGSLDKLLRKRPLAETEVKDMFKQILEGLAYLHSPIHKPYSGADPVPIVHQDLKCQNILLTKDLNIKLCDFGTSKFLSNATTTITTVVNRIGTEKFMAPELFEDEVRIKVTTSADIWSTGCVLVQMLTRYPPWEEISSSSRLNRKLMKEEYPTYTLPDNVSEHVEDILHLCFNYNPKERPTANDLLKHPFTK